MTQEIKPCPFCGAALSETRSEISGEKFSYWTHPKNECLFLHGHTVSRHEIEDWNRRASPWQPIETAPKNDTLVLLANADNLRWPMRCRRQEPSGHWRGCDADDATHWMPLPEPPEVEE